MINRNFKNQKKKKNPLAGIKQTNKCNTFAIDFGERQRMGKTKNERKKLKRKEKETCIKLWFLP